MADVGFGILDVGFGTFSSRTVIDLAFSGAFAGGVLIGGGFDGGVGFIGALGTVVDTGLAFGGIAVASLKVRFRLF